MRPFKIDSAERLHPVFKAAYEAAKEPIKSGKLELVLQRPSKSRDMEKKYHAMIGDISKTVKMPTGTFSAAAWKAQLMFEYEEELKSMGVKLRKPGFWVLSFDGQTRIYERASSRDFSVEEGSGFIEYLYKIGSDLGARFSEKSLKIYEEYREAQ